MTGMNQTNDKIREFAGQMAALPYDTGSCRRILAKDGDTIIGTRLGADFLNLDPEDIIEVRAASYPEAEVLLKSEKYGAAVISRTPYVSRILDHEGKIRAALEDMAQILGPEVPEVSRSAKAIASALKKGRNAVLIRGSHSAAFGANVYEAFTCMTVLEKGAELTRRAEALGGPKYLPLAEAAVEHLVYEKKYIKKAREMESGDGAAAASDRIPEDSFSPEELRRRQALVDYGKKLLDVGLVQGTWGNLSVRNSDTQMLVTPSGLPYDLVKPADMVLMEIGKIEKVHEEENKPTSEKDLHAWIYKKFPSTGAVIHTHSKYASVFAAAHASLKPEDPDLLHIIGGKVPCANFRITGTESLAKEAVLAMHDVQQGKNLKACFLANHGMICRGRNLEDAMRRAQAVEEAARQYLEKHGF